MTIKLPDPDGEVVGYCDIDGDFQYRMKPTQIWPDIGTNLYAEAKLKQAIKNALEEAATVCEQAKSRYTKGTMYSHAPGMFQIRADDIRKLKEQV